jgi:DNA-binding transcriptional LysR family regulator
MLHLGRLRVLTEVIRCGSFSGAAEALSYTQSAVSQAISRLEHETGAPLVVRDRRGVRPTAAGATLVDHAQAIFAQVQAAEDELGAVLGVRGGRLRVASFPSAGATLLPQALSTFRNGHPGVSLTLVEGEPEDIAPRVRTGELDLALLFAFPGGDSLTTGLRSVRLLEDPLHVALAHDHPLAQQSTLKISDLRGQDWVQTSATSPCARHLVRMCLAAGFDPHVTLESDDYETVQGLVAVGAGVALIPGLALTRVHPGIAVRSLTPTPSRTVLAVTQRGPATLPAARTMLEILVNVAGRYATGYALGRA